MQVAERLMRNKVTAFKISYNSLLLGYYTKWTCLTMVSYIINYMKLFPFMYTMNYLFRVKL